MEQIPTAVSAEWFLNVKKITVPKDLTTLVHLWEDMFPKMNALRINKTQLNKLLSLVNDAYSGNAEAYKRLDDVINKMENPLLFSIVRVLHLKNHLSELDAQVHEEEKPKKTFSKETEADILNSKLILQSFLDYLKKYGPDRFSDFLNHAVLRLVSTVHPNETERNSNLRHYNSILEKFLDWRKNYESLATLSSKAPEFRIRREQLNQLRRAIKAEIEGLWQSDQMRRDPIPVQSEAARILERYKQIFKALPMFIKFVKHLAREAFWLYQASQRFAQDEQWRSTFLRHHKTITEQKKKESRESVLSAIKQTFTDLNIELRPPRITTPILTFSSWKGGDRDGNPFVVASFSNQTLIEQKQFVLEQYVEYARTLLDNLTPSLAYISVSPELAESLKRDWKTFPYLPNIKPHEPYRAKIRFVLEKLENTLNRVKEVKKSAGETTKPLLGQTIPGPSGYNSAEELHNDILVLYRSLVNHGGKSQARSMLQDFEILVDAFGLHMTSIDFRQTSDKNLHAVKEYLQAIEYPEAADLPKKSEADKRAMLLSILTAPLEFNPWVIGQLSAISRDTFESITIFADAGRADRDAIGKFIISMCGAVSDILIMLTMMKFVGMLESDGTKITRCDFDVTGLFETVADLKAAPKIIKELLEIPLILNYLVEHRRGKLTVMMGYSDSNRDGSALASDSQLIRTTMELKALEDNFNRSAEPGKRLQLVFYRGRGDTIPRGYGGSITKAVQSQLLVGLEEDHTEQNRYLRCYSSLSSALDHLHHVYSAHVSCYLTSPPPQTQRYQRYFDFFGRISNVFWVELVRPEAGCLGNTYFGILRKYTILPHLPKSHFASRPVARDGVTYNIDSIRAIPFTMDLAQLREFTNAYYGTGSAFELGAALLQDPETTALLLLKFRAQKEKDASLSALKRELLLQKSVDDEETSLNVLLNISSDDITRRVSPFARLLRSLHGITNEQDVEATIAKARQVPDSALATLLWKVLSLSSSFSEAVDEISWLISDLMDSKRTVVDMLREMYTKYPPFRYSMENKETALLIRNKQVVDEYTRACTDEERAVLDMTEKEAQLTKSWLLNLMQQPELVSKTIQLDYNRPELYLLHKIQKKFFDEYKELLNQKAKKAELDKMSLFIQMTILALSEALGFAG